MDKQLLSTSELAKILGISRVAVFKKIKAGDIKAQKSGRSFVIRKEDLPVLLGKALSKEKKALIEQVVKKVVREYGETLRLLGQE